MCDDRTMGYDPEKVGNILEHSASLTGNFYFLIIIIMSPIFSDSGFSIFINSTNINC